MEGLEVLLCVHDFFREGVRSFAFSLCTYLYLVYLQTLNDGDMALMDMGAEYNFYGSDITCSYPTNGKFTRNQAVVYNAVLKAHNDVIALMPPGVKWIDMHK